MDIKEIALKIAQATNLHYIVTSEMHTNDDWNIRFAEALVAEIAKQNEPVAWMYPNETALSEHETDGPVVKERIPLYTIPPTAEQIANETAEACAELAELMTARCAFQTVEHYKLASAISDEIRSGVWKEFK